MGESEKEKHQKAEQIYNYYVSKKYINVMIQCGSSSSKCIGLYLHFGLPKAFESNKKIVPSNKNIVRQCVRKYLFDTLGGHTVHTRALTHFKMNLSCNCVEMLIIYFISQDLIQNPFSCTATPTSV